MIWNVNSKKCHVYEFDAQKTINLNIIKCSCDIFLMLKCCFSRDVLKAEQFGLSSGRAVSNYLFRRRDTENFSPRRLSDWE